MKILIEGERYSVTSLKELFDDPKFYRQDGQEGVILSVGYYHSYKKKEIIYMLPKVFMTETKETVFGISKEKLFQLEKTTTFKHKNEFNWIRRISVYFYNSLLEFRRRNKLSSIVQRSLSNNLNTNLGQQEYSYLDLLLSIVNFYKKNKKNILFKHIESKSQQIRNPNWEKTIRKTVPLITKNKQPIYSIYRNKKKVINSEEELFIYFFSILNHLNVEHNLYLKIDRSYSLIKGAKFKSLEKRGLAKLKKIKYRYFNDTLKKMYHLCEIYFSQTDESSNKKRSEEFIAITNYNLVFEDMIDKLFSPPIKDRYTSDGISLKNLKFNEDGKIIDHIFDYKSLLDTSDIFYIGDSKYYKSSNSAGKVSKYKQFTYAKNVIQYNIDLLNENKYYLQNLRYRDSETEGYNITPNFFIYGYIKDYNDFDNDLLEEKNDIVKSFHFEKRLFDRDTLFVHQYKINFLFVLKAYSLFNAQKIEKFRLIIKNKFRTNFINFFNDEKKSEFSFYEYSGDRIEEFIDKNFRTIIGKVFKTKENRLIIAKYKGDNSLDKLISFCKRIKLE